MADRNVYGKTHSENGWPMVDTGSCVWVKVPGTNVTLQIREGQPVSIMGAFAADFNAYVEPLRDADSACWTATNSVSTSNHLSGTGMDLNWNGADGKTFRLNIPKDRAYPGDKARKLDELIEFYEGMIFCGGNWSIRDWMHFQMGANTYGSQNVAKVNDFIRRKIRPDGFSTFNRGGASATPVQPGAPAVFVLARATGISEAKAQQILLGVTNGLRDSQCTNSNRIAMWLAQMGHESAGFNATEEYASGAAYEGRTNLGNTQPGDGVRFKGRSWIQITGRSNYTALSKWANGKGIVPTPTFFVDSPAKLAEMQYAGLGPAWYWTVARADINELSDRRDLINVTQRINGGQNGIADRRARYDQALAVGDQLMQLLDTDHLDEWEQLMADPAKDCSRSIYRSSNDKTMTARDAVFGADATSHMNWVEQAAIRGEQWAIGVVATTARGQGPGATAFWDTTKVDPWAVQHAQAVLAYIEAVNPAALQAYLGKASA